MFKKSCFVHLPYDRQGLIYFICHNFEIQPPSVQKKILDVCQQSGKGNAQALFDFLTTDNTWQKISNQYHIEETTLYRARKKFYEAWFEPEPYIPSSQSIGKKLNMNKEHESWQ